MDLRTWLRAEWDRFLAVTLIGLGAVALVLGYWGVAHARYTLDGLAFLVSGGLGGLFLLGLGATVLLSADLHDEWRKFDRIEAQLADLKGTVAAGAGAPVPGSAEPGPPPATEPAPPERQPSPAPVAGERNGAPVVNRLGLLAHDPGLPGAGPARILGAVGLAIATLALAGGWVLAARATETGVAAGGIALAAAGLVVLGATAAVRSARSRRLLRGRERRLFSSLGGPVSSLGGPVSPPSGQVSPLGGQGPLTGGAR